jgi:hypothetical protein
VVLSLSNGIHACTSCLLNNNTKKMGDKNCVGLTMYINDLMDS